MLKVRTFQVENVTWVDWRPKYRGSGREAATPRRRRGASGRFRRAIFSPYQVRKISRKIAAQKRKSLVAYVLCIAYLPFIDSSWFNP